jgi:hypothetical protein
MIGGFIVATLAIAALTTLTPSSPFIQEAIIIVFVGAGIGASMPLMNIAIQNEFEQKNLGVATSSSQLFRGLGSTIGVAVFGSMLTLGIANSLGDMKNDAYIQTLTKSPAASQLITSTSDANTLLNLNMQDTRSKISAGFATSIDKTNISQATKDSLQQQFAANQQQYKNKVSDAFTSSLHKIFLETSSMMYVALILSSLLKERPLRTAKPTETPGEI